VAKLEEVGDQEGLPKAIAAREEAKEAEAKAQQLCAKLTARQGALEVLIVRLEQLVSLGERDVLATNDLRTALQGGQGVVGFSVQSSRRIWRSGDEGARDTEVWARVVGAEEKLGPNGADFVQIGRGDVGATLRLNHLDLSLAMPILRRERYATEGSQEVRVFLEVLLVERGADSIGACERARRPRLARRRIEKSWSGWCTRLCSSRAPSGRRLPC